MRQRISKIAGSIGLALGLAVIGGSVIGGIALATDRGGEHAAAVADAATTGDSATSERHGAEDDGVSDEVSGEATEDDDDCEAEDRDDASEDASGGSAPGELASGDAGTDDDHGDPADCDGRTEPGDEDGPDEHPEDE